MSNHTLPVAHFIVCIYRSCWKVKAT